MEDVLSRKSGEEGMLGMDRIEVGNVALGEGFPVLSNARVRPSGDGGVVSPLSACERSGELMLWWCRSGSSWMWITPTMSL